MMNSDKVLVPDLRFPEFVSKGEWKRILLGKICQAYSGGTPSSTNKEYYGGKIPFIRSAEIDKDSTELYLTNEGFQNSSAKMISKGDILYALYGANSGDVAIAKQEGAINQAILCLKSKGSNNFIYQFLLFNKSEIIDKYIQGGQGNLSGEIVKSIQIAFPERDEQQKIADCLSSLDELIAAHTQKHQALQLHKKGLMQNLFPAEGETVPELRFPEFRDKGEWEDYKLEDLSTRGSGHTPNKKYPGYYNGGIKWVSLADSNKLDDGYIYQTRYEISEEGLKNSSVVLHSPETVILSRDAGVGKSAIIFSSMSVSQHFITWQCNKEKLSNWFLYYLLQKMKPIFESVAVGSTIKTIGLPYFKEMIIVIPKIKEQQKIADFLSSLDDLITAQAKKIESLKAHKKGLMQQLFPAVDEVSA